MDGIVYPVPPSSSVGLGVEFNEEYAQQLETEQAGDRFEVRIMFPGTHALVVVDSFCLRIISSRSLRICAVETARGQIGNETNQLRRETV